MQSGILNCIMVSYDSINLNLYFCTCKGKLGAYFLFDICLSLTFFPDVDLIQIVQEMQYKGRDF